jgi:hypothetical protein
MGGRWSVFPARNVITLSPAPIGIKPKDKPMAEEKFYSSGTQVYWTCKALLANRTISHRTEIREVHGWRLGAIIHRLKHDYNWPINAEYRGPQNVAHYSLKADIDRSELCFPPSAKALADHEVSQ